MANLLSILLVVVGVLACVPLAAAWGATRRDGLLTALCVIGAAVLALVGLLQLSVSVVAAGLLLAAWPRWRGWPYRDRKVRLRRNLGARGRRVHVDPTAVGGTWGRSVRDALTARDAFIAAMARAPKGALKERLVDLRADIDATLVEVWEGARRGHGLDLTANRMRAARRAAARRDLLHRGARGRRERDPRLWEASGRRDQAARQLDATVAEQRVQVQVLVARLDEAACAATALAIAPGAQAELEVDLAGELAVHVAALQGAMTEIAGPR